jgi:Protein of unknown function (DUF3151)
MTHENLLGGPPPTYLPNDAEASSALRAAPDPAGVAARFPAYPAAWAALAERAMRDGDPVAGYAYARTGYHRGLDQLRRAGWKGYGPIPWEHEPNRGFLRSLHMLAVAADAIGEDDEARRCREFLSGSSAAAAAALLARGDMVPPGTVPSQGIPSEPRGQDPDGPESPGAPGDT